jgi:N-glycosylase/DNA lyase
MGPSASTSPEIYTSRLTLPSVKTIHGAMAAQWYEHRMRVGETAGSRSCSRGEELARVEAAWRVCADLYTAATQRGTCASEDCFRSELVFCLLSGHGVTYELALSASTRLANLSIFDRSWKPRELRMTLETELARPQFEPRRLDGSHRKYRYPARKADTLMKARTWVMDQRCLLTLQEKPDENERRTFMCGCPGVGLKTSSWLLVNLGLARNLAILDVHVLRCMEQVGKLLHRPSLPREYATTEKKFVAWCKELGASTAAFDLFLWDWQRGSLGSLP